MESSASATPIKQADLNPYLNTASRLVQKVAWTPRRNPLASAPAQQPAAGAAPRWRDTGTAPAAGEELSIITFARQLVGDPVLLTEEINHTLTVVRRGLQLGMYLSSQYGKFSGLEQLVALNERGGLSELQKAEFRDKYQTASAIGLFVTAYYVSAELAQYKADALGKIQLEFPGIPETSLQSPVEAVQCAMFYYAASLEKSGLVRTSLDFVKLTQLYFRAAVDDLRARAGSLKYTEPFTERTYKLEESEFSVNGFAAELRGAQISVEFNRVELTAIVGNRDAKHAARRLAERLICYDPVARKNPIAELGGLTTIAMGHGEPGTGKSMLIAATATLIGDHCKWLGLPFLFWPLPDTIVSTFQGGSAERMTDWMRPLRDPNKLIYAPIDDAENNLEERTRQGVSAGVREVIGVFLRNTEGAYAINRGNAIIQLFTNLPDQVDRAVMSRIVGRYYIPGAVTWQDFLDQDHLWWRRYVKVAEDFVDLKGPADYTYLENQKPLANVAAVYADHAEPSAERIRDIFERTRAKHDPNREHLFFAAFYTAVKERFPFFTSRDVRNIQRAVDGRVLDFDFPAAWFENPETFFARDYDTKHAMLVELMRGNLGGVSFAEVRLQETVRYLDEMVRIADQGREREIGEVMHRAEIHEEALRRAQQAKLKQAAR